MKKVLSWAFVILALAFSIMVLLDAIWLAHNSWKTEDPHRGQQIEVNLS